MNHRRQPLSGVLSASGAGHDPDLDALFRTEAAGDLTPVPAGSCVAVAESGELSRAGTGNRWMTTESAVDRFLADLTPDYSAAISQPDRSPSAVHRRSAAAGRELERIGA